MTEQEKKESKRRASKKYRDANREKIIEQSRKYYQEHIEEEKSRSRKYHQEHVEERKKYREDNKEELKKYAKKYRKKYHQKNREKIKEYRKKYRQEHKQEEKEYRKKYHQEHKQEEKEYRKKYHQEHKEEIKDYRKRWKREHKGYHNKYSKKRREKDPIFRLNLNISHGIRESLKSKNLRKNGRHWEDLVGYTVYDLKAHLEGLFTDGMSWDNKEKWHIDHIIPKSFFKYTSTDDVEFKYCWSLNNLQPLWAEDNFKKSNKIIKKTKELIGSNENDNSEVTYKGFF